MAEHDPQYGRATDALIPRYLRGIAQDADAMPRPARLQRRTRGFARIGRLVPDGAARQRALRDEARHAARLGELFRDYDVLLTPGLDPPAASSAAEWEGLSAARTLLGMSRVYPFTGIWNMTGQPAISIPAPPRRRPADRRPAGRAAGRRAPAAVGRGPARARAALAGAPAAAGLVNAAR